MAVCLNCVASDDNKEEKGPCFCKITPDKIKLKRSASLKDSPPRSRKGSLSEKRSLSMSSLHRSKSVQKLDFTMDMSVDGSLLDHSGGMYLCKLCIYTIFYVSFRQQQIETFDINHLRRKSSGQ